MPTWPTATKASTGNLDAGTDKPSLARADLKLNVDNVNDVIDTLFVSSPTNGQILKYVSANARFEMAADADTNTTYSISAETGTGGTNLRLTDSTTATDDVLLAQGTGITITRTDANTITIASTVSGGMTDFTLAGDTGTNQTIGNGNTLTIAGGTNLNSVASNTDIVTVNLDTTLTGLTSVESTTVVASTVTTSGATDLVLHTNSNFNSGVITIQDGANGDITVVPNGTGKVHFETSETRLGINNTNAKLTTKGTGDLTLDTNSGTNSGFIQIADGVNGNISLEPNGTGRVIIDAIAYPNADGANGTVLQTNGSGTLTFAAQSVSVSTGITGLGTGIGTFLATPSSANLIAAITDESGTGALLFANSPTLVTPALGTPASGNLTNTTVDGTNAVGFRNAPAVGTKTGSYTLAVGDVGKYVQVGSGGAITIPNSTFAEGDVVLIVNNHSAAITITCTITDAYIAGTDTDKATVSLATRGVASLLFVSATRVIISGNVT